MKGVNDLIQACVRCDVKRLVYTSTYNVVFAGQDIVAGDEGLDYPPDAEHPDLYGPSKAQAERTVLDFDGAGGRGRGGIAVGLRLIQLLTLRDTFARRPRSAVLSPSLSLLDGIHFCTV